ncbi:MAG: PspC domain-containing protein [Patescibacteria group bacterium]
MKDKKIYRDQETALVAGVLSGLAEYFKQDPVVFRLIAIVLLILTGFFPGILFYLMAWAMMPRKPKIHADYTHEG